MTIKIYVCMCRHQSHIKTHTVLHTSTTPTPPPKMNWHSSRVGVMSHGGDAEAVCLQSVRVYVWRSDTIALWQRWWVLLVSAQCIWQQGDVTVNGSVMTTGWLCDSWLLVHLCLTADTILEQFLRLVLKKSYLVWASKTNCIVSASTTNQWNDNLES